jgi:hypothetical protein
MKDLDEMCQSEYDYLLSSVASLLHTYRRNIKIVSWERVSDLVIKLRVKRIGVFNHYCVSVWDFSFVNNGISFFNEGLYL